jgi:hypothetical protein
MSLAPGIPIGLPAHANFIRNLPTANLVLNPNEKRSPPSGNPFNMTFFLVSMYDCCALDLLRLYCHAGAHNMIVCAEAINKDVPVTKDSKEGDSGAVPPVQISLGQSAGVGDQAPDIAAVPSILDGQVGSKEDPDQPHANDVEPLGDSLTRSIISVLVFNLYI